MKAFACSATGPLPKRISRRARNASSTSGARSAKLASIAAMPGANSTRSASHWADGAASEAVAVMISISQSPAAEESLKAVAAGKAQLCRKLTRWQFA